MALHSSPSQCDLVALLPRQHRRRGCNFQQGFTPQAAAGEEDPNVIAPAPPTKRVNATSAARYLRINASIPSGRIRPSAKIDSGRDTRLTNSGEAPSSAAT